MLKALDTLMKHGAHLVPLHDKQPAGKWRWRERGFEYGKEEPPHDTNGWGLVPASVGLLVIDCDDCDDLPTGILARVRDMAYTAAATSKGWHIYIRWDGPPIGNRRFDVEGTHGDIRHTAGYVKLYEPLIAAEALYLEPFTGALETLIGEEPKAVEGRNQKLHADLLKAEPGSPEWDEAKQRAREAKLPNHEIATTERSVLEYRERTPWVPPQTQNAAFEVGDVGLAAKVFADWLRAADPRLFECSGKWYTRRGECWISDHKHRQRAQAVIDDWILEMVEDGTLGEAGLDMKNERKWLSSATTKKQILDSLGVREDFEKQPDQLNNPPAIGLPSGAVVDGGPQSIVTRMMAANPEGECPTFLAMVDRIIDDPECRDWLRAWLRVAAGGMSEAQSVILFGPGGTGKSFIVERIAKVFGEYGRALQSGTLFVETPQVHEAWKLAFYETRLVYDADVRNAFWGSTDWLKLTAGDKISSSRKGGQPFEFKPTAGLLIASNQPPMLRDGAMQRRVAPISCSNQIVDDDGNIDRYELLKHSEKLDAEIPGVVKWLLDLPLREAMRQLNTMPAAMRELKRRLIDEGDPLGGWLRAHANKTGVVRLSDLHSYLVAEEIIDSDWHSKKLAKALRSRDFKVEKRAGWISVFGLELEGLDPAGFTQGVIDV